MNRLALESFGPSLLSPCDLTLAPGETITLSGSSGTGKSLFLRAIADLDPHEGNAWLDEQLCTKLTPREWRGQVSYLPAESHWWGELVADHFSTDAKVKTLLEALAISPNALDWEITRLSSGERQRLAIARLLSIEPKVLLLDEPTANLDDENTALAENAILDFQKNSKASIIWVTHSPEQKERLQGRRFVIEQNAIVEERA